MQQSVHKIVVFILQLKIDVLCIVGFQVNILLAMFMTFRSAIPAVSQLIKLNLAHICNFILPCSWLLLSAEFAEPTKEENNNLWCRFGHWLAWLILTFDPNNTKQPSADLPYLQNLLQTPMTSSDNAQWESALVVHGHFTIWKITKNACVSAKSQI